MGCTHSGETDKAPGVTVGGGEGDGHGHRACHRHPRRRATVTVTVRTVRTAASEPRPAAVTVAPAAAGSSTVAAAPANRPRVVRCDVCKRTITSTALLETAVRCRRCPWQNTTRGVHGRWFHRECLAPPGWPLLCLACGKPTTVPSVVPTAWKAPAATAQVDADFTTAVAARLPEPHPFVSVSASIPEQPGANDADDGDVRTGGAFHDLFLDPELPGVPAPWCCPVCQEEEDAHGGGDTLGFSTEPRVALTVCGHVFHKRCIVAWLRNPSGRSTCPLCRRCVEQ